MIGRCLRLYPRMACRLEYCPSAPGGCCHPLVKSGCGPRVESLTAERASRQSPGPRTKMLRANGRAPLRLESPARTGRVARRSPPVAEQLQNHEIVPADLRQESGIAKPPHHRDLSEQGRPFTADLHLQKVEKPHPFPVQSLGVALRRAGGRFELEGGIRYYSVK
jgi:hypothetical protein